VIIAIFFETGDNRLEDCLCFGLLISRHCFILVTWLSSQTPPTSALLLSSRRQNSKEGTRDLTARKNIPYFDPGCKLIEAHQF
jgi:hypothetical protein